MNRKVLLLFTGVGIAALVFVFALPNRIDKGTSHTVETRTVDGIVVNKDIFGGDLGFMVFSPESGKFLQHVVYSFCQDNPDVCERKGQTDNFTVDGYRPTRTGEHVRVDITGVYDRSCADCGPISEKILVTKLPDIAFVAPIVPEFAMTIYINDDEIGTFDPKEGMDLITSEIKKVAETAEVYCPDSGWRRWLDRLDERRRDCWMESP